MRVRRSLSLLICAELFCGPISFTQEPGRSFPESGTIRVNVNVVSVGVTVRDSAGTFVKGLHRDDFRAFDNGTEQPITGFLPIDEPAQVVLMLEAGPAAFFTRKEELQAADRFLHALAPADRVAVVTYSRGSFLSLDFTKDKNEALEVLRHINFMMGSGQLDLAPNVAAVLDWLATYPGKKTLVLLSSGIDTSSDQDRLPALQHIKTADARILAVSTTERLRAPARGRQLSADDRADRKYVKQNMEQADHALREIAEATGGRAYFPKTKTDFDDAFDRIADSITHEYSLAFTPPAADGKVHTIKIKVNHLWSRAEYRQQYLAPAP